MASDQSSSTVLTSDSDKHTGLYEKYDDVRKDEILSTSTTNDLCGAVKTHTAVGTAILAGIATVFAGPVSAPIYWTYIAGVSTAANGLTNYITCDGSTYEIDKEAIKDVAQEVYEDNSLDLSRDRVKELFDEFANSLIFQQSVDTLEKDLDRLKDLIPELTKKFHLRIHTADQLIMIGSYYSSAYPMVMWKKGSDVEPETSSRSAYGGTCRDSFNDFVDRIEKIVEELEIINWENQKALFLSEASCSRYGGIRETCHASPQAGGSRDCNYYGWECSATYGRNDFELKGDADGRQCDIHYCGDQDKQATPVTEEMLLEQEFKPKFDEWYEKIAPGWEALIELHEDLQEAKLSDEYYAERNLCGKFEKPLCLPRFFYNNELTYCCDGTSHGENNIRPYQCGNLEGTCIPNPPPNFDKCKPGFECVKLDTILSQRPSERDLILERTGWGTWESTSGRYVCYSAEAPLPGPFDVPAITLSPTFSPTNVQPHSLDIGEVCSADDQCITGKCKYYSEDGMSACGISLPVPSFPPPSPGPCFSSESQVNVLQEGLVPISGIKVGDYVQSKMDGSFSRVYALEKNHYIESEFYQLLSSSGTILELTNRHMIYLKNRSNPIPAREVKVGDILATDDSSEAVSGEVTKIELIRRNGYYNPLTEDGTIILNGGVVASSFSVAKSSSSNFFDGPTEILHWHTLSYLANAPLRFVCKAVSFNLCSDEQYQNEQGLHKFVVFLKTLSNLPNWQKVIGFPFVISNILLFALLEYFYDLVGEAFYAIISSTSVEAATSVEGSFGFLLTFSLITALAVPGLLALRKRYFL